jgi:hypothetical protein
MGECSADLSRDELKELKTWRVGGDEGGWQQASYVVWYTCRPKHSCIV